jgi:hypothetical protein
MTRLTTMPTERRRRPDERLELELEWMLLELKVLHLLLETSRPRRRADSVPVIDLRDGAAAAKKPAPTGRGVRVARGW